MRTPGPWEVDKEGRAFVVNSQIHNGDANDQFYGGELIAESIFNPDDRKLISAAPELLEACKQVIMDIEFSSLGLKELEYQIRHAIAKAERGDRTTMA